MAVFKADGRSLDVVGRNDESAGVLLPAIN